MTEGQDAGRRAAASTMPGLIERLRIVLGRDVVAVLARRSPRAVDRWASGEAEPSAREKTVLHDAYQIVEILSEVEPDEVVRAWFMGMNPQLDESPAEAVRNGRAHEAMAAARASVNAG